MLLLVGCATAPPLPRADNAEELPQLCLALFEQLDRVVAEARVGDAGSARIQAFPWLRVNRPLASFRFELDTPARRETWVELLGEADADGRRHEVANLSESARVELSERWRTAAFATPLPEELGGAQGDCRQRLNVRLLGDEAAVERLVAAAQPPDAYNDWQRVLGLYPLTRLVVLPRIASHQKTRQQAMDEQSEPIALRHYAVHGPGTGYFGRPESLPRDALGIPQVTSAQRAASLEAHAPVWAIHTRSTADHPGALVHGGDRPVVDTGRPAEYRHLSWARFRGEVLLQLSYVLWFPERPPESTFDIYAGHLDGLVWRVTLKSDGLPLAYESIHPCGCYYTVFPAPGWRVRAAEPGKEPVFAPLPAPVPRAGERIVISLDPGTHYISGVEAARTDDPEPMAALPLDVLRSLPLPRGGRRSVFAPDGLIPSSRRPERFLLWPLGVPSAGAMRQWGTHAIAFVGKRHFDDPYLLDSLLERENP